MSAPVAAFDFWLALNPFVLTNLDWATAAFSQGDRFPASGAPILPDRVDRIVLVRPDGTRTSDAIWNLRPELNRLVFDVHAPARDQGAAVVAVTTRPERAEVAAARFTRYLRDAALDRIVSARAERHEADKPGRERFTIEPKALLAVGSVRAAAGSPLPTRPVGAPLTLEIVPERNPYAIEPGDRLTIRVLFRGAALADAGVSAKPASFAGPGAYAASARTDAEGRASIPIAAPGVWLVRVVHMIRASNDRTTDWESYWASLTFQLADTPRRR